jgi:hypothetical protein
MSAILAACLTSVLAPLPQDDLRRAVPDRQVVVRDAGAGEPGRIVVKLAEGSGEAARRALADAAGDAVVQPFFAGLELQLAALRARVLAALPPGARPPADLALYHEVRCAPAATAALLARLAALPAVELAYPRERAAPPPGDILPVTPSFVTRQGHRAAAPSGIDALAAQQTTGAWGRGITVLDIEWGWWFDHEDLAVLRPASLVGPPVVNNAYNDHGVAVIGELAGDPDRWGVTGLTPDVRVLCATDYPATGYSVAAAIVVGLPYLQRGDVMLLEAQTHTPLGLGPTEWNQADFDAIQNATRLGVVVVEAAGNGGVNLDDARLGGLFDVNVRDSGAIVVGATNGSALQRASFSCYGTRIDANGWGANVASTGYGDMFNPGGDRRQYYTASFNGTSSASPIVTSAVIALLGAARAQLGPAEAALFDHRLVRQLLRSHGTVVPGPQNIGRRPDLLATFRAAFLERGTRLLDPSQLGRTFRIELAPPGLGANDSWALLAAPVAANLGLGLPLPGPLCDRLLLDPSTLQFVGGGGFATNPAVITVPVPADQNLIGARFYFQALTLEALAARPCLTNSVMAFVEL